MFRLQARVLSVDFFKVFFSHSAEGAYPIVGNVFKFCTWSDAVFRVANLWVVNPIAYCANVFVHIFRIWFNVITITMLILFSVL